MGNQLLHDARLRKESEGCGREHSVAGEGELVQGSCQVRQVARRVNFKAGATKFEEDFTVYELGGVDVVLGNTFLHYYGV